MQTSILSKHLFDFKAFGYYPSVGRAKRMVGAISQLGVLETFSGDRINTRLDLGEKVASLDRLWTH